MSIDLILFGIYRTCARIKHHSLDKPWYLFQFKGICEKGVNVRCKRRNEPNWRCFPIHSHKSDSKWEKQRLEFSLLSIVQHKDILVNAFDMKRKTASCLENRNPACWGRGWVGPGVSCLLNERSRFQTEKIPPKRQVKHSMAETPLYAASQRPEEERIPELNPGRWENFRSHPRVPGNLTPNSISIHNILPLEPHSVVNTQIGCATQSMRYLFSVPLKRRHTLKVDGRKVLMRFRFGRKWALNAEEVPLSREPFSPHIKLGSPK